MRTILVLAFILVGLFSFSQESKKEKAKREENEQYEIWLTRRNEIEFPIKDGVVNFELIDSLNVADIQKGDLVSAFKQALADILKEAKRAIDVDDRDGGVIVAKVYDSYFILLNGGLIDVKSTKNLRYGKDFVSKSLRYTLKFNSKDGRFRLQLTDIEIGKDDFPIEDDDYHSIPINESGIIERMNYNKMTVERRERSILLKKELRKHLESTVSRLSAMTIKKANDNF